MSDIRKFDYTDTPGSTTELQRTLLAHLIHQVATEDLVPAASEVAGFVIYAGLRHEVDGQHTLVAITGGELQPPARLVEKGMLLLSGEDGLAIPSGGDQEGL